MGDLAAFRAAVAALFKPNECAVSLFGHQYFNKEKQKSMFSGDGDILWLDDVVDPEKLDSFWTLSVPGWYQPEMGNIYIPKNKDEYGVRTHNQEVCLDGMNTHVLDVYRDDSPFLVFEIDNLLVEDKNKTSPEIKKLQREAMAYAFQESGFPFAVLIDSGGKSVHATVRLDDPLEVIAAWRKSKEFSRLVDLSWVVFGNYDKGILKESGKARLVRTPGARRDDGSPQTILATGQRCSIQGLMQWFANQLSPEAQQEVWGREPIDSTDSPLRQRYLRIRKWRSDLMHEHTPGNRGKEWMFITKSLQNAGCCDPKLITKPTPSMPYGRWNASWLWHLSAFVYNQYSHGWFFSTSSDDWQSEDRERWDNANKRMSELGEQLKFEKADDPLKNALVDQMLVAQATQAAQQQIAQLPMPPQVGPPVHVGGVTGATLQVDPNAQPVSTPAAAPKKKEKKNYRWYVSKFEEQYPRGLFVKLSKKHGDEWMIFKDRIWVDLPSDYAKALIVAKVGEQGAENKLVAEIYGTLEREYIMNEPWVENPHAIAFQNGTLYIHPDRLEFKAAFDPADKLRSLVPCNYDPAATCPQWETFIRWALPDSSRLSLLQEAFGYTLIPGQPYQSFFMLTGSGSNGKSVVLAILQALHKDSFETVALANLGGRFSLGTLGRKRLAIDTEAENVTNLVMGEGNSATAILKAWTGGDPVKMEAKKIQGWSETINAKYFMACNRKPRFVDPTKGVWRRLKLLKFESHIEDRQADRTLPQKLIRDELPGIVNWAVLGLIRLVRQNGFTQSDLLTSDLLEYQVDSDSVAQFFTEHMRPSPEDTKEAWYDVRPFHEAYKQYCGQIAVPPVGESEFRQRLTVMGVHIGRPGEADPVQGCPQGYMRLPGQQYWSVKGWRCYHPGYGTQSLVGSFVKTGGVPQTTVGV